MHNCLTKFVDFFSQEYCNRNKLPIREIDHEVYNIFQTYNWPGNIRELKNEVERMQTVSTGSKINASVVLAKIRNFRNVPMNVVMDTKEGHSHNILNLKDFRESKEKEFIQEVLKANRWSTTKTAAVLCISRQTLFIKMKKYNIAN